MPAAARSTLHARLKVVMIQKEHARILGVLLEWHSEGIGDIDAAAGHLAQQHAHHSPLGHVLGDAVMVIHRRQQHQRVDDHEVKGARLRQHL